MDKTKNIPSQDIVNAFGFSGEPTLLPGGQGTCYRVEHAVFKPIQDAVEASWLAEINHSVTSDTFRVPKPIRAKDGSWVFNGWTASEFLQGEHRPGHYAEAIALSTVFHEAVKSTPKPDWFDKKTDVFSVSDHMAWGELPPPNFALTNEPLKRIFGFLKESRLPNQFIHGDWGTGQILFHNTLPPGIVDMTPYFRPADYPIADMIVSALAYEGADASIIDLGKNIQDFDQLLLRALAFRMCTFVGFQLHPENERDHTAEIMRHVHILGPILKKISK